MITNEGDFTLKDRLDQSANSQSCGSIDSLKHVSFMTGREDSVRDNSIYKDSLTYLNSLITKIESLPDNKTQHRKNPMKTIQTFTSNINRESSINSMTSLNSALNSTESGQKHYCKSTHKLDNTRAPIDNQLSVTDNKRIKEWLKKKNVLARQKRREELKLLKQKAEKLAKEEIEQERKDQLGREAYLKWLIKKYKESTKP